MIEFELKYKLTGLPQINLPLVKQKGQTDIYYDLPNGFLFTAGNFLRVRNSARIDFKLFAGDLSHTYCRETSFNINDIKSANNALIDLLLHIGLEKKEFNCFEEFLKAYSLEVLCPVVKNRKEYHLDNVIISLDEVEDIGLFLEAECHFENNDIDITKEKVRIEELLLNQGILTKDKYTPVKIGYVELYLKEKDYDLYLRGKYKD